MIDRASELHETLHKSLAGPEPPRSYKLLHASDLVRFDRRFCAREWALKRLKHIRGFPTLTGAAEAATHQFGRAIEHSVRNDWLRDFAYGDWSCHCEGLVEGFVPPPCQECGQAFEYQEMRFRSPSSGVSGGIDLFFRLLDGQLVVVEVKSLMKEVYAGLIGPIGDHALRTRLYLRILGELPKEKRPPKLYLHHGYVLYVCKGGYERNTEVSTYAHADKGFSPFKIFEVERNDVMLDQEFAEARKATRAAKGLGPMPARICPSPTTDRARSCPVRDLCFGDEYPVGKRVKT